MEGGDFKFTNRAQTVPPAQRPPAEGTGCGCFTLLFFFIFWWSLPITGAAGATVVAASSITVILLLISLFRRFSDYRMNRRSQYNAELAADVIRSSRNGTCSDTYILFLRPFDTDWRFVTNTEPPGDLLSTLQEYSNLPCITIGAPRHAEHRSSGMISTEDDRWQEDARSIMQSSEQIVILPIDRPGTNWETRLAVEAFLQKTAFLMPPALFVSYVDRRNSKNNGSRRIYFALNSPRLEQALRKEWHQSEKLFIELGLIPPAYNPSGLLFWFRGNQRFEISIPTSRREWARFQKSFRVKSLRI